MAHVYTRERGDIVERGVPPTTRTRRAKRPELEAVRRSVIVFTIGFSVFLYGLLRLQGHLFLNPDHSGRAVGRRAEHDRELRHEHELAVLRRRGDDVVPQPDGRTGGAAVRFGRRGAGRGRGGHPRHRAPRRRGRARQFLARPLPLDRLHPAAALDRPRGDPDLAGRAADVPRSRDGDDAAGRAPDDRPRPGRLDDRDQAARDERRRLLQLELRRAVREPDGALELLRDARDPADPVRADRDVRADGPGAAARGGALRRVLRDLRDRRRASPTPPSSTARRCCANPA